MSKTLSLEELEKLINKSITKLTNLINDLKNDTADTNSFKKAGLLAYWISDYVHMLRNEKTFDSKKLLKYNRGDIVSVNFGYRVGSELGGKHFAIVLDNHNSIKSDVVTVLPLTSKKDKDANTCFCYELKHGLFELHEIKLNKLIDECSLELNSILATANSQTAEQFKTISKRIDAVNKKISEAEDLNKSLARLKDGTIVNVGQIVTISKIRILNPKKASDSLNKIRISGEDLDAINEKIAYLYLGKNARKDAAFEAFASGVQNKS